MKHFVAYMLDHGTPCVSCFNWSGGILRGLRGLDSTRYADNLLQDYRQAVRQGTSLSIMSKSLGGLIAEKALALLGNDVQVNIFLRVGVPDVRTTLRLPNVCRVVNVTSHKDQIFRLGQCIVPHFAPIGFQGRVIIPENVRLRTLTHSALTEYTILCKETVPDATTYDLYWRLLNSAVTCDSPRDM